MLFVTSCGPHYHRPWIFPTLGRLSCRVVCLLHPSDKRELPPNVERVPFLGDRYYQDGRFLDAIPGVSDDEVVILADADAHMQRDFSPSELDMMSSLGDGLAAGWNAQPGQTGEQEFYGLERSTRGLPAVAEALGLPAVTLRNAPVFNWGLVAGKARTWRRLAKIYQETVGDKGELFSNPCYMQYLLCVLCHHNRIPIRSIGYLLHSHEHFPPLSRSHAIKEGKLYYNDKLVCYAHYVQGVTHIRKHVLLALPRLGPPEYESCFAAFCKASADRVNVTVSPKVSSLLAFGFNQSWCDFVNGDYDYFAMLHADVHPKENGWLDILVDDLEASKFGVMHAPVAIKDDRGLTSTAVGLPHEPYRHYQRLSIKEMARLPEVFGYEEAAKELNFLHVGGCLLPNTGCLLVKREGFPIEEFTGFHILDQVVRNSKKQMVSLVAPEDWEFGRWCARNGVKVGCTQRVHTHHFGRSAWMTDRRDWGTWATDTQCRP